MDIHHRYFIQYMLKHGVASLDNALKYCGDVSKGTVGSITQLKALVFEINREISEQYFKIVFSTCEVTNQDVVIWLNTKDDDISKLQISYSKLELEYFQAILQEIVRSPDYRITFIVCINITSTLSASFSRDNGQKVLNSWLKGGYYIRNGDFIYLGVRTILEYTSYLKTCCPESICNLCSELVFTGKKCSACSKTLHSHCMKKYLSNQSQCPCCNNVWKEIDDGELVNNINADSDDDDDDNARSQIISMSNSNRKSRARPSSSHLDEFDMNMAIPGPSRRKYC